MPWNEPGPLAGTAEQAAPNSPEAGIADSLVDSEDFEEELEEPESAAFSSEDPQAAAPNETVRAMAASEERRSLEFMVRPFGQNGTGCVRSGEVQWKEGVGCRCRSRWGRTAVRRGEQVGWVRSRKSFRKP
jgi:hypothetical protein